MTQRDERPASSPYAAEHFAKASPWVGWIAFAGVTLMLGGAVHVFQGVVALVNEDYFGSRTPDLVIAASYTTWGWVQIVGGVVMVVAGLCIFGGQAWARIVGVLVAFASAVASLGSIGANPAWCAILIALDIVVIWALSVHGSEIRP